MAKARFAKSSAPSGSVGTSCDDACAGTAPPSTPDAVLHAEARAARLATLGSSMTSTVSVRTSPVIFQS